MLYPITEVRPKLKDVIQFLAKCAYPKIETSRAIKRIRTTIRSEASHLVYSDSDGNQVIDPDEFFTWAVTKKKWRAGLGQVINLPLKSIEASSSITLGDVGFISDVIVTPDRKPELEARYIEAKSENQALKQQNSSLLLENSELKKQISAYVDKEKRISEERSKAGKSAAGIPKNKT